MVEVLLENGKTLEISEAGDCLNFKLWDSEGLLENETNYDAESIVNFVFD